MTVQNFVPLSVVPGTGAAGLVVPIPSNFYQNVDVKVYLLDADPITGAKTQVLLALGTDYTLTKTRIPASRPAVYTGSIAVIGAVAVTQKIAVMIRPENEQIAALSAVPFDPSTYENLLDLAAMRDGALLEFLKRGVRLSLDLTAPQPIISPQDGYILGWSGSALVNLSPAQVIALATPISVFAVLYDTWFRSLPITYVGQPIGSYYNNAGTPTQVQP